MLKKPLRHERLVDMAWMVGVASSPQTEAENLDRDVMTMLQAEWRKARTAHDAEAVLGNHETRQAVVERFLQEVGNRLAVEFTHKP